MFFFERYGFPISKYDKIHLDADTLLVKNFKVTNEKIVFDLEGEISDIKRVKNQNNELVSIMPINIEYYFFNYMWELICLLAILIIIFFVINKIV